MSFSLSSTLSIPACVYYSLPMDADCVNASVPTRSDIFCKGFCKELFDGCINFKKYWHLEDEVCTTGTLYY